MTRPRNKERQEGEKKTQRKDKTGKAYEQYKNLPAYETRNEIVLKMPKV
jgi:hypothetical protein